MMPRGAALGRRFYVGEELSLSTVDAQACSTGLIRRRPPSHVASVDFSRGCSKGIVVEPGGGARDARWRDWVETGLR